MIRCSACGRPFLTQREADLCTPRAQWEERFGPDTADPFAYLKEAS